MNPNKTNTDFNTEEFRLNTISATFFGDSEDDYQDYMLARSLKIIRLVSIMGLVVFLIFGIWDHFLSEAHSSEMWKYRLFVITPLAILSISLTYTKYIKKLYNTLTAVIFLATGTSALLKTSILSSYEANNIFPAFLVIMIFFYALLNMKFLWSSLTGLTLLACFLLLTIENESYKINAVIYQYYFFMSINVLGMAINYILNYQARKNYFFNMILVTEKENIANSRAKLEEVVSERTEQLNKLNLQLTKEIVDKEKYSESLADREEKYRNLIENSTESMVVVQDEKLVFVNKSFLDFTGVTTAYLESVTFVDFIHPDDQESTIKRYNERMEAVRHSDKYNIRILNKNGMYRWAEIHATRVIWEKQPASLVFFRDITDRKIIEDSLRESEKKYRTFIENAHDAIFLMNDKIFLDCNRRTLEMFACQYDDIIGDSPSNYSPEFQPNGGSSASMAMKFINEAFERKPQLFLWKHKRKDDTVFDAEVSLNAIELGDSKYIMAIVRDVTERIDHENLLLEKEEFLRHVIDISPNLIFVKNYDGEIVLANKAMAELVDTNVNDITGMKDVDYHVNSEEVETYIQDDREVMDSMDSKIIPDEKVTRKNGDVRYFHTTKIPLLGKNGKKQLLGVSIDITDNKTYLEALMRSEERYRKIFDSSPEIIGLIDKNGVIIDINNKIYEWLGYMPDQIIGKSFIDIPSLSEETKIKLNDGYQRRMSGEYVKPYEIELKMHDGKMAFGLFYGVPLRNDEGEIEQEIILIADITSRKKSDREIKQLNKDLEKRVENRTNQLKSTLDDLQIEIEEKINTEKKLISAQEELAGKLEHEKELNELKSRFISMVSHEYRTPLTVIQTCSYIIEKIYDGTDQHTFDNYMYKIRNAVQAMTSLLEDVLFIGRSEAGKLVFKPAELDIINLIEDIIEQSRVAHESQHEFSINSKLEFPIIQSDQGILRQIFSNLLSNAAKYAFVNTEIVVNLEQIESNYIFEVVNQGIGIEVQDMDKLFDPFHRGNNIGVVPGTGLGLSIVKRSAKMLKGNITVESIPNETTKFILVFPTHYPISNIPEIID
jgi:PAS domain S-box-containing protein